MHFDPSFLDDIRARVPISSLIGQRVTFDRKKSNPARGDHWFCCCFHGEKSPSAHCEDRKGRYHCFGCGASGDHFKFLMEMDGVNFARAVEILADFAGLPMPNRSGPMTEEEIAERDRRARMRAAADTRRREQEEKDTARRIKGASAIWKETVPLMGTLGQLYLEWRGLMDPKDQNLRFHPGLEHLDSPGIHPCVIAKVQAAGGYGTGIWRIFLQPDGHGKLAGVTAKLGLGPTAGGAVRLGGLAKHIGIGEGIESCLAARALGHTMPIWATLSTSGMIGFVIPDEVKTVTIFPDRDTSKIKTRDDGRVQGSPGLNAAQGFIERYPGRDIRIADGPEYLDYLEFLQQLKGHPIR